MIFISLHSHSDTGIYEIISSNPSRRISILLEVRLFQGIFIFRHPRRLYLILKGRLSFLMILLLSTTFLRMTSPDQIPILRFSALKFSIYYPRILLRRRSTNASNISNPDTISIIIVYYQH